MALKNIRLHIRSICLKKMLYPFLLLFATMSIFYYVPFREVWEPFKVSQPTNIINLFEQDISYIEVTPDILYYSGYDYYENGKEVASYYYNIYEETCVFYLISSELTQKKAEILKNITLKAHLENGGKRLKELIRYMATDLKWTSQGLAATTTYVVVNEHTYWFGKTAILFYVNSFMMLIAGICLGYTFICFLCPQYYSSCVKLKRYGPLKKHFAVLEREILEPKEVIGSYLVTEHYLIEFGRNIFQFIPLEQILWAYKHSKFHRFRKQRLTYTLRIICKQSIKFVSYDLTKEDADGVLQYLSMYNSDIEIGYSREQELFIRQRRKDREK